MTEWATGAGAFLFGRKTYEIVAESWPQATDPSDAIAAALNGRPKFVASRTLGARLTAPGAVLHVYERGGAPSYGEVEVGQETVVFD